MSQLTPPHALAVGQHILVADEDSQPLVRVLSLAPDGDAVRAVVALVPLEDKLLRLQFDPHHRPRVATTKRVRARLLALAPVPVPADAQAQAQAVTPVFVSAPAPYTMLRAHVWREHPLHDRIVAALDDAAAAIADLDVLVAHTRAPPDADDGAPDDGPTRTAFVAYVPLDAALDVRPRAPGERLWAP